VTARSESPGLARYGVPAGVALGLAIATVYAALFILLLREGLTRGSDYTAFYTGWTIVLEGRGADLYDPAVQAEVQQEILGGETFEAGLNPFNNPPYAVLPFVPLALLSLEVSFLVWTLLNVGLLALVLRALLRTIAGSWSGRERAALVALALAFSPIAITFFQGSFSLILLGGLAATVVTAHVHPGRAGAALAAAAVKPQGVFGAGLALVAGARWRAVGSSLVVLAALSGLATLVLGPGIWASYVRFLTDYLSSFDTLSVDPAVMWNLRGTLTLLLGSDDPELVNRLAYLGFVAGALLVLGTWLWHRPAPSGPRDPAVAARWALTICLTAFFAPHFNPHDDVVLILAAALAWGALRTTSFRPVLAAGLWVAPFLILLTNGLRADAPTDLPIRVPTVLLLGLMALLVAALVREPWRTRMPGPATAAIPTA
jgi:hypothetical protein